MVKEENVKNVSQDITMHEFALAQNIVETIKEQVTEELDQIAQINIEIGVFSGVVPESLEFGIQAIFADQNLPAVTVNITRTPSIARCACGREYEIQEIFETCPDCSSFERKMISGMDIVIKSVEVTDLPQKETLQRNTEA